MGLDGYVACDCIEKGHANVPPAITAFVKIDQHAGSPYLDSVDKRHRQAYNLWRGSKPCPHDGGFLMVGRLGSANGIGWIRGFLTDNVDDPEAEFPVLWNQVVYSGVHSGDSLSVEEVRRLAEELKRRPKSDDKVTERFFSRLGELVAASMSVGKPLGF